MTYPLMNYFRRPQPVTFLRKDVLEIPSFVSHGSSLDEHANSSWILSRYIPPEKCSHLTHTRGYNLGADTKCVRNR